jgi:gliding motility-associated-like protein
MKFSFKTTWQLFAILFIASYSSAQCPVTAFASKSDILCGDSITLSAISQGCIPLEDNFESGSLSDDWEATQGAVITDGTGEFECVGPAPEGGYCLWMGDDVLAPREVQTEDYSLTECAGGVVISGSICFYLKYATQANPPPCEGIDALNEGVFIQYSIDSGDSWNTIKYFSPGNGYDPIMTVWTYYCFDIPPAALTPSTRFRWYQDESSIGTTGEIRFDTWGIDDMKIILNGPGYTFDWAHDGLLPSSSSATPVVKPTDTTTYSVTYSNGTISCVGDVTVNVNKASASAFVDKEIICAGGLINLKAITQLAYDPPTTCDANSGSVCDPAAISDEVTLGNGTHLFGYNDNSQPPLGNFGDAYVTSHILYLASELDDLGMTAGSITNMQWIVGIIRENANTRATQVTYNELKIDMGCTSGTSMVNFGNPSSTLVNVFNPKRTTLFEGQNTFFFDNSYNWDGKSNIVVRVCWRVDVDGSANDMDFYAYTRNNAPGYNCVYSSGSNFETGQCATSGQNNLANRRPNTIFGFCKPGPRMVSYNWSSIPTGFVSTESSPSTNINTTTSYIVHVNEQGANPGCAVTDTVEVVAYKPVVNVNPNPASICPPTTTSVELVSTSSTNMSFRAPRKFTNNNAQSVQESGSLNGLCGTAGPTVTSVIPVAGITPATLAANPIVEVTLNMPCTRTGDYQIRLTGPSGQQILLSNRRGAGANFTNTRFRTGSPAIAGGASPFNGAFAPDNAYTGIAGNINGNWTISIVDMCTGTLAPSTGTLTNWSITFTTPNYIDTYLWTPAAGLSSPTISNPVANPGSTTNYTLVVTDAVGCKATTEVPVTVGSAPEVPVNDASICGGAPATLTASPVDGGGGTYSWSPGGQTTQSITVNPASTTGYTVTYSNGECAGTGTGTVTVAATPTLSIADKEICDGSNATLDAIPSQTGGTYSWETGATTSSISVSPAVSRYYRVTYTRSGCQVLDSAFVTVTNAGTVSVNSETVCAGTSANIAAVATNPSGTYSWTPGGATTASITVSPSTTTTYIVTYQVSGCSVTGQGTVTVQPNPILSLANKEICLGNNADLTANTTQAGGTFLWTPGGQTTQTITVSPAATQKYYVSYDLNGCSDNDSATVTVNGNESITIDDDALCTGESRTIEPSVSNTGGTYLWSPGGQTTPTIAVSPTTTTLYSVEYTITGCTYVDDANLMVSQNPTLTLKDTAVCQGGSVELIPTVNPAGGTYSWSTSQTTPTITVSPSTNSNYSITYDNNGCIASASNTVNVNPAITANMTGGGQICGNQTIDITVDLTGNGPWKLVYTDGTANFTINNITSSPYTIVTNSAGNYSLVSVRNAKCTGTVSGSATVTKTSSIVVSSEVATCDINDDYEVYIDFDGGDNTTYSVTGTTVGSISGTGPYTFYSGTVPGGTPNYSYTITDASGCNSIEVSGIQNCSCPASASMTGGGAACEGNTVDVVLEMTGVGPYDVVYSENGTNVTLTGIPTSYTIAASVSGTYSLVSMEDAAACSGSVSGSAQVTINPNPTVAVIGDSICLSESGVLSADPSIGGGTYSWSSGQTGQSITLTPSAAGSSNYVVTYSLNGCTATGNNDLVVSEIPTVTSNDTAICAGTNANLYAITSLPGGAFLWTPVGVSGQNISVTPNSTSNYEVNYTLDGCSSADVSTVTVNPSPSVTVNSITVCEGEQAPLTANVNSGGGNYLWSPNGEITKTINVTPGTGTNNYSVDYTLNGCTSNASATVTVKAKPSIAAVNDTICPSETATLVSNTNTAGGNYNWKPGIHPNAASLSVSPTATTSYTLTYTANGCTNSTTGKVVVNPAPTMTVNSATICAGEDATLTATVSNTGGSYSWTPGGQTTNSITVSPATTARYYVSYILAGCSILDSGDVIVSNSASVTVNDSSICEGNSARITAVPSAAGGTYSWTPGGQTSSFIDVSPANTTNYTVTYSLNGCQSTNSSEVTVTPAPTVDVTDNVEICQYSPVNLTATPSLPNGTYSWLSPPANNETTKSITVSPNSTTKYFVTYNLNGCTATDSGTVIVTPTPSLSVTNDNICQGDLASLTATTDGDPSTISWTPGAYSGPTINVSPSITTTYTATISLNGCTNTQDGTVTVSEIPTVTVSNTGPYCEGNDIQLNVNTTPNANYTWAGPNSFTSNAQNPTILNSTIADSGLFEVLVSNSGCDAQGSSFVAVNAPLQNTITNVGPYCEDEPEEILVVTYPNGTWSGTGVTDTSTGVFTPSAATMGNNVITYTAAPSLCQTDATITIVVNPLPTVEFSAVEESGCAPFTTNFVDQTTPASAQLTWDFGNGDFSNQLNSVTQTFAGVGFYDVTLTSTSADGCLNQLTKPQYIEVLADAIADFDFTPKELSTSGAYVSTTNLSQNANSYLWSFGNQGTSAEVSPKFTFTNALGAQEIMLIATNAGGCSDTIIKIVTISEELLYFIPNAFTPDLDKHNQVFHPIFTTGYDPQSYSFEIFNRWGQQVFQTNNAEEGWDGYFKDEESTEGAYMWVVNFKSSKTDLRIIDSGSVMLIK